MLSRRALLAGSAAVAAGAALPAVALPAAAPIVELHYVGVTSQAEAWHLARVFHQRLLLGIITPIVGAGGCGGAAQERNPFDNGLTQIRHFPAF